MTDQNSKKLSGIVPLPPREVSAAPYIVQPGDTVESITGRFTHPSKWPGLVGANVHRKELADAEGQRHAVFADLKVGEALLIPAAWVGVGTPLERRIARMNERLGRTQDAPKTLTQMQIANPWDQRHPQWPGSQVAYWSQRIEAIINHAPNWHVGYHKSCAQQLVSGQGRGRLVAWLRSFGTPQQLVDAFDTGPLGVALYVPDDLWFYGADRNVAVRAANSFAGQSQCGRTSGSVGAPGQVGGCQTYGMDQFGGVAGFKQMTQGRAQSQAQLQAAPKQLPQFQSVWDQKHPNWNGSNLAYWTQRIEAYIMATPVKPPGLPAGWQALLRGFLRQWPTPEAFAQAQVSEYASQSNHPPTVTGEKKPTSFPNQEAAVEWLRQAYSVPGYWYADGDDPKFAAVAGYFTFPIFARKIASATPPAIAHQGSVGVPFSPIESQLIGVVSPANPIVSFFVANWATINNAIKVYAGDPNWQVPVSPTGQAYTPSDIARVVAGFLPYLAKMPAGSIPPNITTPVVLPADPSQWGDPSQWSYLIGALSKSAAELLGVAQVKSGDILQVVPWDEVPWHSFPWPAVKSFPNCWSFFQSSMQTDTVGQQMSSKLLGGAQWQLSPVPNHTPSFLQPNWQQAPWTQVPWGEINWTTVDPSIWNNDKVVQCMKGAGAPTRLQQMFARQDCFIGKGADVFAKYLCPKADGTYEDLTTCNQVLPPLPGCPAGMHLDENGVCVPDGQGGQLPKCAAGYQAYPAPQLPQGIACCPDGSIFDLTTGQCLKPGQPGTDPASPVAPAAETQGLSTFAKAAIAVAAAGTLGLVYAIGKKS